MSDTIIHHLVVSSKQIVSVEIVSAAPYNALCKCPDLNTSTILGVMLSNPIDLRVYLTEGEFKSRVLQSKAWAEYLKLPPIPPFDEAGARSEIADRNEIRLAKTAGAKCRTGGCEIERPLRF